MKLYFINFPQKTKSSISKSPLETNHKLIWKESIDLEKRIDNALIFYYLIKKNDDDLSVIREFQSQNSQSSKLVLVSAFAEIAILAWRLNCFYFIQLPLNLVEIDKCIHRLSDRKPFTLSLKDGTDTHYISETDVNFLKADGNYTSIHLRGGKHILVSKKIKYFESLFSAVPGVVRIGRSFMLNLKQIKSIESQTIQFKGPESEQLKLSTRYLSRIKKLLSEFLP